MTVHYIDKTFEQCLKKEMEKMMFKKIQYKLYLVYIE